MERRIVVVFAVCATVALGGCAQRPEAPINTPITAAELAPYKRQGRATVLGHASLRREGAAAVTCARQQVFLIPAIGYNRAMIAALRAGQKPVPGPNVGSSEAYWRKSVCDARGRFRFRNVPAAAWYVSIAVRWKDQSDLGAVVKEVRVPIAGTVSVVLSDADLVR